MKRKITKEHRVLDDTDLNIINNTFKEIKHDFNNTFKEIKHDNNNNFNRIDNTFKLFKSEFESSREKFEYSIDVLNGKLNFILWFVGIGFAVLGVLIKMS
jgi:hypothetical protein